MVTEAVLIGEETEPPARTYVPVLQEQVHVEEAAEFPAEPTAFQMASLGDGRFRVVRPFHVVVSTENDDVIANAVEVDEFGFGGTRQEAIRDLQRTVVALLMSLEADEERLGPDLQRVLAVLRTKAHRVR